MVKIKKRKKRLTKDMSTKELRYNYQLLRDFMDRIPDVIYFKDKLGRLIMVNQAHAKAIGLTPEEVAGKTDFDIFPKERAKVIFKDDQRVMEAGKPIIDKIERSTLRNGTDVYVSTTKIPRYNDKGEIIGLMGITRDITRRMQFEHLKREKARIERKLEVLEELNKLKSDFISTVSHELRTPLAIVKQLVMLVFEETAGPVNDKQRETLKRARDNIERLKNLIDNLLDISRIERDKLRLHYSLVNINALIKDSSDFFKKLAEERDISLKYYLPKEEVNLFVDVDRINQVLSNLINNAIKFTEEGGKIKIELKVLETKIRFGVIDTGFGIAKSDLPLLFNKFVQVSKVASAEKKGVGLGLSIVKELIEKHGGEIWVESKLGVGTKFYFTLLRFYTPSVLDKRIKERIDSLLKKGVSVHFINLLIINYDEFKEKIKNEPARLFKDLHDIIDTTFKEACWAKSKKAPLVLTDIQHGKCSIILPGATKQKAVEFCKLLKDKIKKYLIKNIGEDVFITLGILSYSKKLRASTDKQIPARISIKEIYIGSEMRRFKRVPYKTNIKIFFPKNKTEIAETIDISEGGVCLATKRLLKTDSKVRIRLELPKQPIYALARVAWIKKAERLLAETFNTYKVGLDFIDLENKYRKILCRELKL